MKRLKLLIVAQSEVVFLPYKILLQKSIDIIDTLKFDALETIDLSGYDVVIFDIESFHYIKTLDTMLQKECKEVRTILVSPFSISQIQQKLGSIAFVELMLTKPLKIDKLLGYIETTTYLSKKNSLLDKKNRMLVKLVELFPANIAIYTPTGTIYYANNNFLQEHSLGIDAIDTKTYDEITKCNLGFKFLLEKLQVATSFTISRHEENRWFESTFYKAGKFVIHYCRDITEQKNRELRLEQAAVFFENSSEGIVVTDENGVILSVNTAFSKITGYTPEECIGKTPAILNSGKQDARFYENMWDSLLHNGYWQGEIYNKRKNGEIYPEWLSISKTQNPKYKEASYIAIFSDISAIKASDEKLHFYANHDVLTGLANRVNLQNELELTIKDAKRKSKKFALLFIDLDKFKEVNDTFGHSLGDEMLKTIAKRVQNSIKSRDFLARIGGDEFVLIAKELNGSADVVALSHKLKRILEEPIVLEDNIFFMTLSIGIAIYPDHGQESELLTKHADAAMYVVKESGRDGYMIYDENMTKKVSHKLSIQNELKSSIDEGRFVMYYQAVVDMRTNRYIGAEALVRWVHPTKGIVTPYEFINFIEDSPMCTKFGLLVIQKVMSDIKVLKNYFDEDFKISINISSTHFFKDNFERSLLQICQNEGVNPCNVELELLETHIMHDKENASKKIEKLKNEGFHTAIDDFGTGYSSLSYLKNFNVDKLKIDQSFIRDFLEDNNDKDIVEAIIKLSKVFNLKVQAEGVETLKHHELLIEMGCDVAQGYYYNKPMPIDKFIEMLKKRKS